MFKISPINDKNTQRKYAELCGAEYKENYFAYSMIDSASGELMGFSQFEITDKGGFISDIRALIGTFDYEAMFILGRATMNFIDLCSVHTCYADPDAADSKLLHAIGFRDEADGKLFCNMEGMFDGNCSSHK